MNRWRLLCWIYVWKWSWRLGLTRLHTFSIRPVNAALYRWCASSARGARDGK